jgi:hypothetical protein
MPTYELTDGQSGQSFQVDFDKQPTSADMDEAVSHFRASRTSTAGAFGRGAATSVVPSFGAWGGARAGAKIGAGIGALVPGFGETGTSEFAGGVIGGAIGGIAGSIMADKAQNKALQTIDPEAYNHLASLQSEDIQQHPVATRAGELAGALPAFKLQNPFKVAGGIAALSKIARGKVVTKAEQKAAKVLAMQAGFGTALGVVGPAIAGKKPTVGDITQGVAQMILFGEPRLEKGAQNALDTENAQLHGRMRPRNETEGGAQVPSAVSSEEDGQRGGQGEAVAKEAQLSLDEINLQHPKPVTRPAAATADIIDPEHQKMLDIERGNAPFPVDVLTEKEIQDAEKSGDPFAQKKGEAFRTNIATIDRDKGRIVINPHELNDWLNNIPPAQRQMALRSLLAGEESIHLSTSDASARAYIGTLTGLERTVHARMYLGPKPKDLKGAAAWDSIAKNDTMLGHEALAYRFQQLMKLTPRVLAEAVGREKWTLKSLAVLESTVRGIRETLGTKASREATAILDKVDQNIKLGKAIASGAMPGAVNKEVQDRSEQEAQKLEEQAQMYLESGDAESANELKAMAAKLRGQTGEQYFPGARPKEEEAPPGERLVTVRRQDGTTYQASFGGKYYDFTAQGRGRVPSVAFLKEGKWSHGILPQGDQIVEEHFPGARPKKRQESVFQDKFILPGMETTKVAGTTKAGAPTGDEAPPVPEEQRASAEAAGALPRLTGAEIERRGNTWVQDAFSNALKASQEGGKPSPPKFQDFVTYLKGQEPKIQAGQVFDLWQKGVSQWLDAATGEQLSDMAKAVFGRESIFGKARVSDKPGPGFKLEHPTDLTAAEKYEDERRAARTKGFREKVVGALYKKLVQPGLKEEQVAPITTSMKPEDIRYGGGDKVSAYQSFDAAAQNDPQLGEMLVDSARRSNEDSPSLTRRVTVLQNKKTGAIEMVSTYKHPSRGVVMLDPLSPRGESTPLESMLHRYRALHSILRDQPVKKFRQSFGSLAEYNEKFGNEAKNNYQQETSYDPMQVPISEFVEDVGGRMEGVEGGMFQGPHKELVSESGTGELEKGETTPLTDAEASAIFDHVFKEVGHLDSPSDVEDALTPEALKGSRQALSGIAKLGREMAEEYPFATGEEIKGKLADRIYLAHKEASSLADFQKRLGVYQKIEVPPEPPSKTGRELTHMRSRAPTTTSKKLPPQYFPGARPKVKRTTGSPEKTIARITWDSLFQLYNARDADIRDRFETVQAFGKELERLPPGAAEKVSDKLDEEVAKGASDIKLTPNEQKIYDVMSNLWAGIQQKVAFLKSKDPTTKTEWFPRILADPNSIFERLVRGTKAYVTEGTVMGSSASFLKSRKIKALTDFEGNRRVAVIVGKGDEARLVAYDKGQAEDLGPYHFKDIVRRGDRLHEELAPINKEADEVIHDIHMLQRTPERAAASKVLLRKRYQRLAELYEEAENIAAKYPDPTLDVKTFMDKNGKEWKFGEATRREIESNMRSKFYRNAYPALVATDLKMDQLIRQHEWMEDFKRSPEFQLIAEVGDHPNRPTDWRLTEVPQLKGIWFHPRLADVFDQFHEQSKRGDWNAWRNMNRALQGALFLNQPFLHDPNLLTWWFATRGASAWLNPRAYPRMYRSFSRAFHDVLAKNSDYTNYLRLGTPLQLKVMTRFGDTVTRMLRDQLESNPPLSKRIASILGFANPIHLLNTVGRAATEGLHDILTLQLIHELEERGIPPHEALQKVTQVMPDRRIPPRVMGSRWLSKMMADGNVMWFAAYHYAEGRAFKNLLKGAAGKNEDMSRAEALDKIAAIALLMFAAYPALDSLVKAVTGKNYALRRAGPTTWPTAIGDVSSGAKSPSMIIPSFISLSPLFTAVPSLFANRNLMNRGLPIYNPRAPIAQQAADIGKFAGQTINPIQMYGDLINGRTTWEDVALNLVGVRRDYSSQPYNKIYGWAYDWAKETGNQKLLNRFNEEANEVYPPSVYEPLKQALEDGNDARARKALVKLHAEGKTDAEVERELRPSSHPLSGLEETEGAFQDSLTPEQRAVYDQEVARREEVYQKYLELSGQ